MKKIILTLLSSALMICTLVMNANGMVFAADNNGGANNLDNNTGSTANCGGGFLGFVPWYNGLVDSSCNIESPGQGEENIAGFVWKIVANILIDLFTAVGYVATGFVIYGGYLYIMSEGDPGRAARGKKTLTSAVIGIVIAVLANLIIRTIMIILGV